MYLMRLDMWSKTYSKKLTGFEHLITIVLDDGSIKNCSRCWYVIQVSSNKVILQKRLGWTWKEIIGVDHIRN